MVLLLLLPLGACGNSDVSVPVGCRQGPDSVRAALAAAPAPVHVGGTLISKCFASAASPGDVQQLGAALIAAAQQLADRARAAPHSAAALQLGYLVGAVRRGAGRDFGIYYETRRRVEDQLIGVNVASPEFIRGEGAGRSAG